MATQDSKGEYVVLFDFEGDKEGTVSIVKGDTVDITDDRGKWWTVNNQRTGESGRVPSNYLSESGSIDCYEWLHSNMDLTTAKFLLRKDGHKKGTFVVIPDASIQGHFRLVVREKTTVRDESNIMDYPIRVTLGEEDRDRFFISDPRKSHPSVASLVQSLQSRKEGIKCTLKDTLPKPVPEPPIDYLSFDIEKNHLQIGEKIGGPDSVVKTGAYGDVAVVLKTVGLNQRVENFREILRGYSKIGHENIIKIFGCIENSFTVVLECCPLSLLEMLAKLEEDPYERTEDFISYAYQVTVGMRCLEENSIIHGKLCAKNVLIRNGGSPVLINFGLLGGERLNEDPTYAAWKPIEVLKGGCHDECGDVWAYAVVLHEIFSGGRQPYEDIQTDVLCFLQNPANRLDKHRRCPGEYYRIMLQCWNENPRQRPLFSDILHQLTSHQYLSSGPYIGNDPSNLK